MFPQDLELGQLSSRWNERIGFESIEPEAFFANADAESRRDGHGHESTDDDNSTVKVPRQKLQDLMRLWLDVFQSSLSVSDGRDLRQNVHNSKTPRPNTPNGRISPPPAVDSSISRTSWTDNFRIMSDSEIEAENKTRRLVREQWRSDEKAVYLEDTWRHLWEPKTGVDAGLFQWSCSDEKRRSLQLDLVDALNAQSQIVIVKLYMSRDFRSIASWVSLIGLRLNEVFRSFSDSAGISPMTQIEVLIECLWCCNSFSPTAEIQQTFQGPTVGDVLSACYRRRILMQPTVDGLFRTIILREHLQHVRIAIYLLNILFKHKLPRFKKKADLDETWHMLLSSVEASLRSVPNVSETVEGTETFFRLDDLNIRDLQSLGHLQLRWTCYWDEHLQLETGSTGNILKIYWFQPSLAQYLVQNRLCSEIAPGDRKRREYEISKTWSIIFTSNSTEKIARKHYERIRAPKWISLLAHSQLGTWNAEQEIHEETDNSPLLLQIMNQSESSSFCFETRDHLLLLWSRPGRQVHERLLYSQFPVYGDRLRELRAYMDSQQPKGLRALWHDKRNSNTYYTFWFVVIFGSLSVFLAACALAVSIAQTWATFQSLSP